MVLEEYNKRMSKFIKEDFLGVNIKGMVSLSIKFFQADLNFSLNGFKEYGLLVI